jgi:cold shock CspA family protein
MNGSISKVVLDKGFGFILGADGQSYFFHRSALQDGAVIEDVREGQAVNFEAMHSVKGLRAENVRMIRS